ncbi:MAG TPA: hypothetical protein VFE98_09945 [Candidatus Bathyarchaeia archaeon]|nr:hypothetical protein [Candidatus Bathyarchaeia archaeon]
MARKNSSIEVPRELVADLSETSQKFRQLLETLEVQLDPATLRRLEAGDKEYRMSKYKTASTSEQVHRVLS